MGGAYVRKPSSTGEIHEYDVYECVLSNVEVKGKNAFTSIIVPSIGQFAPNLAEGLWMTSGTDLSLMLKAFSLTEIWNNMCSSASKIDCLVITSRIFGMAKFF